MLPRVNFKRSCTRRSYKEDESFTLSIKLKINIHFMLATLNKRLSGEIF